MGALLCARHERDDPLNNNHEQPERADTRTEADRTCTECETWRTKDAVPTLSRLDEADALAAKAAERSLQTGLTSANATAARSNDERSETARANLLAVLNEQDERVANLLKRKSELVEQVLAMRFDTAPPARDPQRFGATTCTDSASPTTDVECSSDASANACALPCERDALASYIRSLNASSSASFAAARP